MENNTWSDKDTELLRKLYPVKGTLYCANLFGRSTDAVYMKARRIKLVNKRIKDCYQEENFAPIVAKSNTLKDICNQLGVRAAGGSFKLVKKYIVDYGLSTAHFTRTVRTKRDYLSELIVGSDVNRGLLKSFLYKQGIKRRVCELCGQGEEWNGQQMSLILDHINGINDDNRLENLRIVCPNCNATFDTHCRGIKPRFKKTTVQQTKPKLLTIDKIDKRTLGTPKTWLRKVKVRPSLEELQKMTAEIGFSATGRNFGVSDNAIRKWMK